MNQGVKTIIYPTKDVAAAKALFTKLLGTEPHTDSAYYVGFKVGDQEIGLAPNGHEQGMTMPIPYFNVDDIKKTLQELLTEGATVGQDVKDVGGGKLIATAKDKDDNIIGLIQLP